jgi:imidazole glycerol-phosphate synthase subunit HisH
MSARNQIVVIDYKAGNLTSVLKSLRAVGAEPVVTEDPGVVSDATKLVLPGVGHFAATEVLAKTGIEEAVRERVQSGVPFLGICVGLQWLFEGSTEAPGVAGLGAFAGMCERFSSDLKVPHVGWNSLEPDSQSPLMNHIENGSYVYFTHAYRAAVVNATVAVTDYGGGFSAAVEKDNVMGVQFHPEKSGSAGLRILRNFVEL